MQIYALLKSSRAFLKIREASDRSGTHPLSFAAAKRSVMSSGIPSPLERFRWSSTKACLRREQMIFPGDL
jgi:hypothetical protein